MPDIRQPGDSGRRPSIWDRFLGRILKPGTPTTPSAGREGLPVDELESLVRTADDKERAIGLLAAPVAALIGILIADDLLRHDPPALLADGLPNKLHVNPSLYHELTIVLLVLAVVILAGAWFRKRFVLGAATALEGLTIFNLRYWGFGVPFVMVGAWYLVRAYRFQRDLKAAKQGETPSGGQGASRPSPNKRYTPPASRKHPADPPGDQKAG